MFYSVVFHLIKFAAYVLNGKPVVTNKDRVPKGNYVLIAPHRTWFDMLYFAFILLPKQFYFIAKKELFKNPIFAWCLRECHVAPVDRNNPGISVVKQPVKVLRKTDLSVLVFPSGTRHSTKLKAGAALIAKTAGVPLVPVVYQGPLTIAGLMNRKHKVHVNFGDPIYIDKKNKLYDEEQAEIEKQMANAFKQLDDEIDPNYVYNPK